ncbi:tetratricopeptide repeat protein [Aestuariicoccus sp. MJ-SS9]|uniref:tetratricopeptide repeat protein n=1 Tax=Aestuariicoccus sp. MJ-SS9 TaxID=3079855 RepID=UPI0029098FBB|nr:putative peptidoglycan-binding domain-containing protein [Aestuariicoccus sp. MJ-SS9]MDU8913956.1 putative peptidoglycan-binding domain-containing protein [Aestuariicoccus sp. MJ-SS9]
MQLVAAGDEAGEVARGPEPVTLPGAVTLELAYDRSVPLAGALAGALGAEGLAFDVTDAPGQGQLVGLDYRPVLSERRSDLRSLALADRFVIEVAQPGGPVPVEVTLDMAVQGCDLAAGDALDPGGVGFYRLPNEIEIAPALAECQAAVEAAPDVPRFRYQLGRAQQAAGLFEAAYQSFEAAAEAGHVRAMNAAALMLTTDKIDRDVVDVPEDAARAEALLDRAIAAGDPFAMHSRGLRLLRDGADAAAKEQGFELLDRAAELGHTYSMNELGVYFLTRDTDHYIPERGMRYLQASAARNDIYGFHNLGFVALYGLRDGTPDPGEAYRQFERAALGGHPASPATLGRMIVRGEAPGKTKADALQWYDLGLARGDGWGGVNGAFLILNGEVSGPTRPEALVRAAKALHLSNGKAVEAAQEMLSGQPGGDVARAVQLLLRDLGADVAVDGVIGPQTRAALAALAAEHGLPAPANNAMAQLRMAAKVYWAQRPTRPDLF